MTTQQSANVLMPRLWSGVIEVLPRDVVPAMFWEMQEKVLHAQVARFARDAAAIGVASYHTHRSDRSQPGFPDWVFCAGNHTYYAELKGWLPSRKKHNIPTDEQRMWLSALSRNPGNRVYLVYPWNWAPLSTEIYRYQFEWDKHMRAQQ